MRDDVVHQHNLNADFLQRVVHQATFQCRAGGSGFYLQDLESRQMALVAAHNLSRIPWDDGLPERVSGARDVVAETCDDGTRLLATALIWQDEVGGVLAVFKEPGTAGFRERDRPLLRSLAEMTASVVQQAERLARMTTQFRTLHAIDVALTSSMELDRVLNLILEMAAELVSAEHGSLRQLEPESGKLVLKAHYGQGWTVDKLSYTPEIGKGIVRWVSEHHRPYLSPDVRSDPLNVVLFEDMRSSIAVPLQYTRQAPVRRDSFVGVLLLESSRLAAFDRQDVELLEALAQEAVIAIQNASYIKKLESEQEKRLAAEKWAVMGQASTALAHRINNLIGIVPVSAREVARSIHRIQIPAKDRRWIGANLGRIERNAEFVLKLSDALFRPFKDSGTTARYDVNQLLGEALEAADLSPEITVERDLAAELPAVESSLLLLDVFLELITNARKAMRDQKTKHLRVATQSMHDDTGSWVVIEIDDSGKGIASEQHDQIWEILYHSDNGLGFGLWWLRTFIERQGGFIECRSEAGQGATFTVRLPAVQ